LSNTNTETSNFLSLDQIKSRLQHNQGISPCLCCLGCLEDSQLDILVDTIHNHLQTNHSEDTIIKLLIEMPAVLDISRIGVRTILTESHERTVNFSTFDIIINKILAHKLSQKYQYLVSNHATLLVPIRLAITDQLTYCQTVQPQFTLKKLKRKYYLPYSITKEDDPDSISRVNIGK